MNASAGTLKDSLNALLAELPENGEPVYLVFDNYQMIHNVDVHEASEALPPTCTGLRASRHHSRCTPPWTSQD